MSLSRRRGREHLVGRLPAVATSRRGPTPAGRGLRGRAAAQALHADPQTTHAETTLPARLADPSFAHRNALVDEDGRWSYAELLHEARRWRDRLAASEPGVRVAYLVPPGRMHVAVQLGIWTSGGIAVPLAVSHPLPELEHVLDDARPRTVVVDPAHPLSPRLSAAARARGAATLAVQRSPSPLRPPSTPAPAGAHPGTTAAPAAPGPDDPALLIYTSGTTGRPKGALATHRNLAAQTTALTAAWGWTASDRILHTLPLHHVHGVVNALACALWSGATCEFGSPAPAPTWDRLASGRITLFMSVPTVYARLVRAWEDAPASTRRRWSRGAARLRLMVSGSAALPVATLERWREITGHTLLERYGMTEIGMALSNPLRGERRAGHVGPPLPGVEVRIVDEGGRPVAPGEQGEIEVRGPQVFREYWGRPGETAAVFRRGWFRTGDEGRVGEGGYFRILGRRGFDIVKTGGAKVSALEVEEAFRAHAAVREIAVVGVPHPEWGEQLRAAWVPAAGFEGLDPVELRAWGKKRLAPYKVPHAFREAVRLPRNAMGKVRKAAVRRMLME